MDVTVFSNAVNLSLIGSADACRENKVIITKNIAVLEFITFPPKEIKNHKATIAALWFSCNHQIKALRTDADYFATNSARLFCHQHDSSWQLASGFSSP